MGLFFNALKAWKIEDINKAWKINATTSQEAGMLAWSSGKKRGEIAYPMASTDSEKLIVNMCTMVETSYIRKDDRRVFAELLDGKIKKWLLAPSGEDVVVIPDETEWPTVEDIRRSGVFISEDDPDPEDYIEKVFTPKERFRFSFDTLRREKRILSLQPTIRLQAFFKERGVVNIVYRSDTMFMMDGSDIIHEEEKTLDEFMDMMDNLRKAKQII